MDLNYLLARHQTSLMRAEIAACSSSRMAHRGLAAGYAARVNAFHQQVGAEARIAAPDVEI